MVGRPKSTQSKIRAAPKSWYVAISVNDDVPVAPDVPRRAEQQIHRRAGIRCGVAGYGKLPDVQRLAAVPAHGAEIAHAGRVRLFKRREAGEFADHAGIGQHAIVASRNEPAGGNGAIDPSCRLAVARSGEKGIARSNRHCPAGRRFYRDRHCVGREFEGADIAFVAALRPEPDRLQERHAPQHRSTFDIGRKTAVADRRQRLRTLGGDDAVLCD